METNPSEQCPSSPTNFLIWGEPAGIVMMNANGVFGYAGSSTLCIVCAKYFGGKNVNTKCIFFYIVFMQTLHTQDIHSSLDNGIIGLP